MKRISIVLVLALALLVTLTACNNTEETLTTPRWKNGEELTFTIQKAVLDNAKFEHNNETYLLEPGTTNYEPNLQTMDEVVPEDVAGTYKMKIEVNEAAATCTFTTEQTLYVAYKTTLLTSFDIWNTPDESGHKLSEKIAPSNENPFSMTDCTTLKSVTTTEVVFKNISEQRPLSSKNHVDGFYIGKTAQTLSAYDLETTYEWDDNKVTIYVNGEKQESGGSYSKKFIDANQILLYSRSLEKSSSSFKDAPMHRPKFIHMITLI